MHEIGVESSVLDDILIGKKTIEGRLGKPKFLQLRVGNQLSLREDVWENGKITSSVPGRAVIQITQLLYFESFKEMLDTLDYTDIIPSAKSASEALEVYGQFYSSEEESEFGVVAIEFELI